jgi:hypothetical protein
MLMKNYKFALFLFLYALVLFSCKNSRQIKKIDYTSQFKKLTLDSTSRDTLGVKIDFCKVVGDQWDSIYVITPYAGSKFVESIDADNIGDIQRELTYAAYQEYAVQLVLVKDKEIIEYGQLSSGTLNLGHLGHKDGSLIVFTKKDCDKFYAFFKRPYPGTWTVQQEKFN